MSISKSEISDRVLKLGFLGRIYLFFILLASPFMFFFQALKVGFIECGGLPVIKETYKVILRAIFTRWED